MAEIIDGKKVSAYIRSKIKDEVILLSEKGRVPGLAVILVGDDQASHTYVRNKRKACDELLFYSEEYTLPESTTQDELLSLIDKLNNTDRINGILVQLPLPSHIDERIITRAISPKKDVDAFHVENTGRLFCGDFYFSPCTPAGIMELLKYYDISVSGKNCVVIGRSNIVGKPMALLLLQSDATVTVCHSKTRNLKEFCKNADILISAVGKEGFVTGDMVKESAVVVDVGINRNENGKLCGDVCFDEVAEKAEFITPVPGGVGPMTISMLMKNTLTAFKMQNNIDK